MADRSTNSPDRETPKTPTVPEPGGPVQPHDEPPNTTVPPVRPPTDPPPELAYGELTVRISTSSKRSRDTAGDDPTFAGYQGSPEQYPVGRVIQSPLGESMEFDMQAPIDDESLGNLIRTLEDRGTEAAKRGDYPQPTELRETYGQRLTAALFPDRTQNFLRYAREAVADQVRHNGCRGLRLRLLFNTAPEAPGSADLNRLIATPWDLLTDPDDKDQFLCRSSSYAYMPLVYSFGSRLPPNRRRPKIKPPLKVLLILQSAIDSTDLPLAKAVREIRAAIAGTETVVVKVLAAPTLAALAAEIDHNEYHAVQFLGHGGIHSDSKEGILFFQHADGRESEFTAREIAEVLRYSETIRLVLLAACRTAQADWQTGTSPFLTVAGALYRAGMPAVVAMRYTVSTPAVGRFSAELYAALAAGDPVDAAMAEARAALEDKTFEWATPVLFLNAKDGRIFDVQRHSKAPGEPLSIALQSFEGWGDQLTRSSDRVLSVVSSFEPKGNSPERRYIRSHDLWNQKLLPQIRRFLAEAARQERPLILEMQAHQTLAFTAGYLLEAKSGLNLSLRQRGITGTSLWHAGVGKVKKKTPLWQEFEDPTEGIIDPESRDLALAISITRPVTASVRGYIKARKAADPDFSVRRIFSAVTAPHPSQSAVAHGAHAVAMASALVERLASRPPSERGILHIFGAAPNSFLFYLGQMAHGLGEIQLYEFEFDQDDRPTYQRSMRLSKEIIKAI